MLSIACKLEHASNETQYITIKTIKRINKNRQGFYQQQENRATVFKPSKHERLRALA